MGLIEHELAGGTVSLLEIESVACSCGSRAGRFTRSCGRPREARATFDVDDAELLGVDDPPLL